jgi:spermidine synthase
VTPSVRLVFLLALFFCSGACGLLYQVLWLRLLSLVFGVTIYAASTVLAAFMAGLALGSFLAAPLLMRFRRPLMLFGVAEMLIGVAAMATPVALDAATAAYGALHTLQPESMALLTVARVVCGFFVLLPPTLLMGMTLPLLSASSLVRGSAFGSRLSALYGINTAGAVCGAILAGFYLIGAIGIQRSFLLGAAVNLAVGLLALWLSRQEEAAVGVVASAQAESEVPRPSVALIGAVIAVSGFASLALEILWFRILVQFLAATTYAFTTMLATVLAGIAAGGVIAARVLRRDRGWTNWLAVLQLATAIAVLASSIFLAWSYARGWRTSGEIQASIVAILPAALLMGMSFPIAMRAAIGSTREDQAPATARRVGRLYALNVLGAIAGSLCGGFVLLPWLGSRRSLIAMGALFAASAVLLVIRKPIAWRMASTVAVGVLVFGWLATRVPDPFAAAYERRYGRDMREYWRDEGVQTAVSVHASQFRHSLYLDGLHQANDTPGMVLLHRVIGHLPMLLHPDPRSALVIGLGGGATAGAVSQYSGAHVQVVELSDGVRRAAPFFAHISYDVLKQPNVRLRVDDGRNFLLLSNDTFDVITADIIQPIHAGAGNLYSREYFSLVRKALKPNGIALQWIGQRSPTQYRLIMRTFLEVFPEATLWLDGNLMVGSVEPLRVDPGLVAAKRLDPRTRAALDDIGLRDAEVLRSWFTAGPAEMRRFVGEGLLLTDDRPLLEYHRSLPSDETPLDLSTLRSNVPFD